MVLPSCLWAQLSAPPPAGQTNTLQLKLTAVNIQSGLLLCEWADKWQRDGVGLQVQHSWNHLLHEEEEEQMCCVWCSRLCRGGGGGDTFLGVSLSSNIHDNIC